MTLSVIIPAYNAENNISACCNSILQQDIKEMEIIIVDDGSKDNTGQCCDRLAMKDLRVKVIHASNGGPGSARNKGLEAAKGEWIAFVDADDTCEENYFSKMLAVADGADLVIQGLEQRKSYTREEIAGCIAENKLLDKGSPWGKLYKKAIIDRLHLRFPENYRYGEDTVFFLRYLAACQSVTCIPECGYHYSICDTDSLSRKTHDSIDLLNYIVDSKEAIQPFLYEKQVADRHNVKCVFYAKRAWNNMSLLGYGKKKRTETRHYLRENVLPLLHFNGLNVRECAYLIFLHFHI